MSLYGMGLLALFLLAASEKASGIVFRGSCPVVLETVSR